MTTKLTIMSEMRKVADEQAKTLAPLSDDLVLLDSGLDSLCFAVLVARLEDKLGRDPFTASDDVAFPVTLADFVRVYENMPSACSGEVATGSPTGTCAKRGDLESLRDWLIDSADRGGQLHGRETSVALGDLVRGTSLGGRLPELAGRSVLVATGDQLTAALALIELDGVARRLVLCPPDLPAEHLPSVVADAEVDAIVTSGETDAAGELGIRLHVVCHPAIAPMAASPGEPESTEWVMFTSGTTGAPKMVVHTRAGLTAAIKRNAAHDGPVVWGTFYDIRRYGGLQIFFRAIIDGGSLVLSDAKEPVGDHLVRLGRHGVTHQTGTPSHWRRALMSPSARAMAPRYVRLSGEIADQAILDNLRPPIRRRAIGHAYASTEAGVGFEVTDGRAGFPASMLGRLPSGVEMKVEDGTLRIRSSRTALRYVGGGAAALADPDGFVDTGDMVELRAATAIISSAARAASSMSAA